MDPGETRSDEKNFSFFFHMHAYKCKMEIGVEKEKDFLRCWKLWRCDKGYWGRKQEELLEMTENEESPRHCGQIKGRDSTKCFSRRSLLKKKRKKTVWSLTEWERIWQNLNFCFVSHWHRLLYFWEMGSKIIVGTNNNCLWVLWEMKPERERFSVGIPQLCLPFVVTLLTSTAFTCCALRYIT